MRELRIRLQRAQRLHRLEKRRLDAHKLQLATVNGELEQAKTALCQLEKHYSATRALDSHDIGGLLQRQAWLAEVTRRANLVRERVRQVGQKQRKVRDEIANQLIKVKAAETLVNRQQQQLLHVEQADDLRQADETALRRHTELANTHMNAVAELMSSTGVPSVTSG